MIIDADRIPVPSPFPFPNEKYVNFSIEVPDPDKKEIDFPGEDNAPDPENRFRVSVWPMNILNMRIRGPSIDKWNRDNLSFLEGFRVNAEGVWGEFREGLMSMPLRDLTRDALDNFVTTLLRPTRNRSQLPITESMREWMQRFLDKDNPLVSARHLYEKSNPGVFHQWHPWDESSENQSLNPVYRPRQGDEAPVLPHSGATRFFWDGSVLDTPAPPNFAHRRMGLLQEGLTWGESREEEGRQRRKWGHGRTQKPPPGISPWQMVNAIGPDFLQHKFDAFFVWDFMREDDGEGIHVEITDALKKAGWLTEFDKHVLSHNGFAVRVGQITIPPVSNEEFTLPFLETEVKKVKSFKALETQASFSFRMDQDLIWLNQINEFSGRKNGLDESMIMKSPRHPYLQAVNRQRRQENIDVSSNWRHVLKTVAKSWPRHERGKQTSVKRTQLCLVVKMVQLSNWVNKHYQSEFLPYFVFENVRILGTGDSVTYSREGGDIMSMTVNFIFKRHYQINRGFAREAPSTEISSFALTTNDTSRSREEDPHKFARFFANDRKIFGIPQITTVRDREGNLVNDWLHINPRKAYLYREAPAIRGNNYGDN